MIDSYAPEVFGKVVVLMGGNSAEREISLVTGNNILNALKKNGIDAVGLDVHDDVVENLRQMKPDRAFIALHGPGGEDGSIQGLLNYMNIPFTGSDVAGCAITLEKSYSKLIWSSIGIPTLKFRVVADVESAIDAMNEFGLPLCIKPTNDGSSVGVTKVTDPSQLPEAFNKAFSFNQRVMIEPWIDGFEYTVGILGNTPLPVIEIQTPRAFYDFDAKYNEDSTVYICPSDLSPAKEKELQDLSLQAFQIVGCSGWGRVDLVADKNGNYFILEVNTVPGMTDHSLVPKAANVLGISFEQLVVQILSYTLDEQTRAKNRETVAASA